MQVTNQNMVVNQYTGTQKSAATAAVADAAKERSAEEAVKKTGADVDKAELSADTKVTKKMSDSERAALVQSLKDDLNNQMNRFTNMMTQMFQKQGISVNMASGNDFWKMMASGNYTVDEKTKAEAQEAISEDGYWGVSQTSQRIFDFAAALAGDDVEKMKEYQKAVEKGFSQAEDAWGGELPSICGDTKSAVNKLFDEYYAKNA